MLHLFFTLRPPLSSGGTGTLLRDCRLLERVIKALPRCLDLSLSTCIHTDAANRRTNSVSGKINKGIHQENRHRCVFILSAVGQNDDILGTWVIQQHHQVKGCVSILSSEVDISSLTQQVLDNIFIPEGHIFFCVHIYSKYICFNVCPSSNQSYP